MKEQTLKVVEKLQGKGGESYSGNGRFGFRNPIRGDTSSLLYSLVLAAKPSRVLELGTAYGLSGIYIASALKNGGTLDTIEFDPAVAKNAQSNFIEAGLPVQVFTGDIAEVLSQLHGSYDCVFFDAEKKSYFTHLMLLRDLGLLADHALIIADNVIDRASEMQDF